MLNNLPRRIELEESPLIHDHNAIAHFKSLVDVMSNEQNGFPEASLNAKKLILQIQAGDGIDRSERLVEQHDIRIEHERSRKPDSLLLSARELMRVSVAELTWLEPDKFQQLICPLIHPSPVPLHETRNDRDILLDCHMWEEADLLNHISEPTAQLYRIDRLNIHTFHNDFPIVRVIKPVGQLKECGLAAAGRAKNRYKFSALNFGADVVDRVFAASREFLAYIFVLNNRHSVFLQVPFQADTLRSVYRSSYRSHSPHRTLYAGHKCALAFQSRHINYALMLS